MQTKVMVLAVCTSLMMLNICIKFYENILNSFQNKERTALFDRNYNIQTSMELTPKIYKQEL